MSSTATFATRKIPARDHACTPYSLVHDDTAIITTDQVLFANLNLDTHVVNEKLSPYMELVGQRITLTYKSPAKISFQGLSGIYKIKLSDWLQFDDVCIKFLHVATGVDVLVSLSTQIARSLLIRLLSTTLVDDTHGVLFSSTEKGIFAFIIARLMVDLKHTLGAAMPDLKLLGVYHCQDESLNDTAITNYGVFNFSFAFAHDHYPVSIALPMSMFNAVKPRDTEADLVRRCGHIKRYMHFFVAKLRMNQAILAQLSFGDLIIFDRSPIHLENRLLAGPLQGRWHDICVNGTLKHHDTRYVFSLDHGAEFKSIEDTIMEELEITSTSLTNTLELSENTSNHKLADLAKSIRVPLSIELSRIPLTLKELCQIREGEIIDLHRKIDDPLDMVVEGKVIGQCQPVQIDGRLGIRVLNIDGDKNAKS